MFDVSGNTAIRDREDEGTLVHVKSADGDPQFCGPDNTTPVTIRVAGTYSALYRRTVDAQRERMLKQRRASLTGDQLAKQQLDLVAACILSWEGITNGAQPFPCTKDNAAALLDAAPWVREDVEAAMSDHAGFSSASSVT